MTGAPHPFDFFGRLVWLDGRALMDTIEPYRRELFERALYTFDAAGDPIFNRVLSGRGKKNFKSVDLALAALYRFIAWPSAAGNDVFIVANDEDQAADDLSLTKKLIAANPAIAREVTVLAKEVIRRDGAGTLKILPGQDARGSHGKTYLFLGFDEIHGYRDYDLLEALSPDPTRRDALVWITSYAATRMAEGVPLYDLLQAGKAGDDPHMLFSWYGGDFTTDPALSGDDVTPEQRANPSMASWGDGGRYLEQQKRRLPAHRYRRLHLNLPGAPDGAAFDADAIMDAVAKGRKVLPPRDGVHYHGFVDMSGGSACDAVLGIAHNEAGKVIVDLAISQTGEPPFDPRAAVAKFVAALREYGCSRVTGDQFAGETFRRDFEAAGIFYRVCELTRAQVYERFEPKLNAGLVELPDLFKLQQQLMALVVKPSGRIDRPSGERDDWANACAGAVSLAAGDAGPALVRASDLGEGETFEPGKVGAVIAVVAFNDFGQAGVAYFAAPRLDGEPLLIIDMRADHLRPELFAEVAGRLDERAEEIRERAGNGRGVNIGYWVPRAFQSRAFEALERATARHYLRPELRNVVCSAIEDDVDAMLLNDPVKLHFAAAAHASLGAVRFALDAVERTHDLPILGALTGNLADRDGDNPLVTAVWLGTVLMFEGQQTSAPPPIAAARLVAA